MHYEKKINKTNETRRIINLTRQYTKYPEGSVLVECGDTKILCTATISENTPRFLRGKNQGWITAEYSMLPRSTHLRNLRESRSKQYARNFEIQRFIGRALRSSVDLKILNGFTIILDCDVLQADGSTRTSSITGSCVALIDALNFLLRKNKIKKNPMKWMIAAVSVGIVKNKKLCDLNYLEDSIAEIDLNVVMTEYGHIIEIQGTTEGSMSISESILLKLLALAKEEIFKIIQIQKNCLNLKINC